MRLVKTRRAGRRTPSTRGYKEQNQVLERAIELAKALDTDKIRVFSFWRVENPAELFDLIVADLRKAWIGPKKTSSRWFWKTNTNAISRRLRSP
jgi:hypothetical protein